MVVLLMTMMVHYGADAGTANHDYLQHSYERIAEHESHVGERVYVWGRVIGGHRDALVIESAGRVLRVDGTDLHAAPGDSVQVAGVIRPGGIIEAERAYVSPRDDQPYLYGVSLVGLLVALGAASRKWTIDTTDLVLVSRKEDDD